MAYRSVKNPQFALVKPSFSLVKPSFSLVKPSFSLVKPSFSLIKPSLNFSISRGLERLMAKAFFFETRQAPGNRRVEAGAGKHRSSGLPMVSMWIYHPEVDRRWDFQRDSHEVSYFFCLTCPYYINSGHYIYICMYVCMYVCTYVCMYIYIYTYVRTYIQSHA